MVVQAKSSSVGTEMRGTFNPKQRPLASETPIRNPVSGTGTATHGNRIHLDSFISRKIHDLFYIYS